MENLRTYYHCIMPSDIDLMGRATIMSLGNYILCSAGEDVSKHNIGVKDLNESGTSWLLTHFAMDIESMPQEQEELHISTWVSDVGKFMTIRNFFIADKRGNTIAKAVSKWAMIHLVEHKAVDLSKLEVYRNMIQNIPLPTEPPRKIDTIHTMKEIAEHKVVYSDIGFDRHTNAMKYLEWVINTIPLDMMEHQLIQRVDMNFINETTLNQTARIFADDHYNYEISAEGGIVCRIGLKIT